MSRIEDQITDSVIDYIQRMIDRSSLAFDELDIVLEGRKNYETRQMATIVNDILNFTDFFNDYYYPNNRSDKNETLALELVVNYNAAKIAKNNRAIWDKLDNEEYDFLNRVFDEMDDVLVEHRRYLKESNRGDRRSPRDSRYDDRTTARRDSRPRYGREHQDDNRRRTSERGSRATAGRRHQHDDSPIEHARGARYQKRIEQNQHEDEVRQRDQSQSSDDRKRWNETSDRYRDRYLSSVEEAACYLKHPGHERVPYFNPYNQGLLIRLRDGAVEYEVKEKNSEMGIEEQKYLIETLVAKHREKERCFDTNREAIVVDGLEIEKELYQNKYMDDVVAQMIKDKEVKEGTTFKQLTEEQKKQALMLVSDMRLREAEKQVALKNIQLMERGIDAHDNSKIEVIQLPEPKEGRLSIRDAVNRALLQVSTQSIRGNDKAKVYITRYQEINPLAKFMTSSERDIAKSFLSGLRRGSTDLKKFNISLKQNIPIHVFNLLNKRATDIVNQGIFAYIKLPIKMSDYIGEIDELAEFLVQQANEGTLQTSDLDKFLKFVVANCARISDVELKQLEAIYGRSDNSGYVESLLNETLFELRQGNLYYLPMTAVELGLNYEDYYRINKADNKFLSSLIRSCVENPTQKDCHVFDDIFVTSDNQYFRLLDADHSTMVIARYNEL